MTREFALLPPQCEETSGELRIVLRSSHGAVDALKRTTHGPHGILRYKFREEYYVEMGCNGGHGRASCPATLCAREECSHRIQRKRNVGKYRCARQRGARFCHRPGIAAPFCHASSRGRQAGGHFFGLGQQPVEPRAWGRLVPKFEIAGLFSYINFDPGSQPNFNNFGATGSFAYNANKWLGLVAEVGGYTFSRKLLCASLRGNPGNTDHC